MKHWGKVLVMMAVIWQQTMWPVMVWGQEVEITETPTPTEEVVLTPTLAEEIALTPTPTEEVVPTPTPTETPALEVTPTEETIPTPTEVMAIGPVSQSSEEVVVVVVDNSASVNNNGSAETSTGNNSIDNSQVMPVPTTGVIKEENIISSGNTVALTNLVNIVNTNGINSKIKIYLVNNVNGQVKDIDLNTAWNILGSSETGMLTINMNDEGQVTDVNNFGAVKNTGSAMANSGMNQIYGSNGNIFTGNAYALVNIFNLLNLNAIDSQLFFGVINVDGSNLGDLILPNPEDFANEKGGGEGLTGIINTANIGSNLLATAESGNNQIVSTGGNNQIITGQGMAWANGLTMTNLNLLGNNTLILGLNTLGNWTGKIYNWGSPGAVSSGGLNNFLMTGSNDGDNGSELMVWLNNLALIENWAMARAVTGGNSIISQGGNSIIRTGDAWAGVNVTNLANLNVSGSRWFMGIINVIGDWKGNAIFAYPDLTLTISLDRSEVHYGEEMMIAVNYSNIGYEGINDAKISVNLPEGMVYLDDNSGTTIEQSGNNLSWRIGNVAARSDHSFIVRTKVTNGQQTWRLVKPVMAEEETKTIIVNGTVVTSKTEVSVDNNQAVAKAYVKINGQTINSSTNLWPKLAITAKNNVNSYVYSGDVVTFEIVGKNEGEANAFNNYLIHQIYNSQGKMVSQNKIRIGSIMIGRSGKITFGVPVEIKNGEDKFRSQSYLIGEKESGEEVKSNVAVTNFAVKGKEQRVEAVKAVTAVEEINQGVLGAATESLGIDLLPYVLLFLLSTFWVLKQIKKTDFNNINKNIKKLIGELGLFIFAMGCFGYSGVFLWKHQLEVLEWIRSMGF